MARHRLRGLDTVRLVSIAFSQSMRRSPRSFRSRRGRALVRDGDTVALEGFTAPDPVRRRPRDHPPGPARPDARPDDARPRLRPADRRGLRAAADLLLGRQPRRRLAAPLPRRGRARLAAAARARGAQPRRHGQPLRRRRRPGCRSPSCAATRAPTCRSARRRSAPIDLPVHRRGADRGRGAEPRRRRSSTPSAPTATATCSSGASPGVQKEAVLAAGRSLVTVEEIVDELDPRPAPSCCRRWAVTRVSGRPGRRAPSYAHGYYDRDNASYRAWDAISARPRRLHRAGSSELVGGERADRRLVTTGRR